jgi:hypothetical protein
VADRNYEDLKAKLGLKKTSLDPADEAPAGAPEDVGEPEGERTPPGGFDLGLERGGATMDSALIDIEKAAARITTEGGDMVIKQSGGIRALKVIILLVGLGAAFAVGYAVQGTQYDRDIERRQTEDADTIQSAVADAKTLVGGQNLAKTVANHVTLIEETDKKIQEALKADAVTDKLLAALSADLEVLRKGCSEYVGKGPYVNVRSALGRAVFNGEAIKALMDYDAVLKQLYWASYQMGEEKVVLDEFKATVDTSNMQVASKVRAWRWASVKDKEGRPTGYLVGLQLMKDKDGNREYRNEPIAVPAGQRLPEGAPTSRWQVHVKYDNPAQVGGKSEDWVDTDIIVTWDLKEDILEPARAAAGDQHKVYQQMLLRRLFTRVAALKSAGSAAMAARTIVLTKLGKLTGDE